MDKETYNRIKELAKDSKIVFVTAKQYPRPPGHRTAPVPKSDIIIVDYISKL